MEDDRELQIPADADRQLKQMLESPRPWHYDFKPLAPLASWLKANEAQMAACTAGSGRKFFARGYNQILWI
jgi:hypothetical protein